jgi:tetratricopeptide (TPR) repeat protein
MSQVLQIPDTLTLPAGEVAPGSAGCISTIWLVQGSLVVLARLGQSLCSAQKHACGKSKFLRPGLALLVLLFAGCSHDPKKFIVTGKQYLAQGKYREAIIEFRNAVQAAPNFPDAHYQMALGYLVSGEFPDAYQTLLRAVQLDPNNLQAQLHLASLLLLDRKYEDARTKVELILKREPNNVRAQILLGNTYAHMIQLNDSIAEMNQTFNREPRFLPAYLDLSDPQDSPSQPPLAEEAYTKSAEIDPKAIEPKLALANFYFQSQRMEEARKQILSALATDPRSRDANNTLAFFFLQNRKLAEAEQVYMRLSDAYPNEVRYKFVIADFLAGTGQQDRAIESYRRMAADDAKDPLPRKRLANIYLSRNDVEKAAQMADEILKIDSRDADVQLIKGRLLLAQNKVQEAVAEFQAAVIARPGSASAHYFPVSFN